jgi:hypothetical protein
LVVVELPGYETLIFGFIQFNVFARVESCLREVEVELFRKELALLVARKLIQ